MPGDYPKGSDGADSKSTPSDKKAEKSEAAKEAVKDLAASDNQKQIRELPRSKEVKYTGGVYTKLVKGSTSEIRKMLKEDDAKRGGEVGKALLQDLKTTHYDYTDGKSRDVTVDPKTKKPTEIKYKDEKTGYQDSWKRVPGTDVWEQYDKNGKPTGKEFEGEVKIAKDGSFAFKDKTTGEAGTESTIGTSTHTTPEGAKIYKDGDRVTDIDYGNGSDGAYIDYADDGTPNRIGGPIEIIEKQADGSYKTTNLEPQVTYDKVTVDKDGVITMYQGGEVVNSVDPRKDFTKAPDAKDTAAAPADQATDPNSKTYQFGDGISRDVKSNPQSGEPEEMHYKNEKTGYEDTWKREPGSDKWEQYDANGNPTGKAFRGDVEISDNGTLHYKDKDTGNEVLVTADGLTTTQSPDGVRITSDGDKVTQVDYGNESDSASIFYDKDGNPERISGPIERITKQPDGSWLSDTGEKYTNVTVDKDGTITMYADGQKPYSIEPHKDFGKLPDAAPEGEQPQGDQAAPETDTGVPDTDGDTAGEEEEEEEEEEAKPTVQLEFGEGRTRDVTFDPETGEPTEIHYTDKEHSYQDTWVKTPGQDSWTQYDANGNPTGQTFEGKVEVGKDGSVIYKRTGEDTATVETSDGKQWEQNASGARVRTDDNNKTEITYPNGKTAVVTTDDKGNPKDVVLPDGLHMAKFGDVWAQVDENGKPISSEYFNDVKVDKDGNVQITDSAHNTREYKGDGSQTEVHNDGSKLETDDQGRVKSVTQPAPSTETVTFAYEGDSTEPSSIDYGNGNKWEYNGDKTWTNASTGQQWKGDVKVSADGTYSYHQEGSDEITSQFPNGGRMVMNADTYKITTTDGAVITADNDSERIKSVDYPNGVHRTFEYDKSGPTKVTYENEKTGDKETWEKTGDDQWVQKDKDGNVVKNWQGEIAVDQGSGDFYYKATDSNQVTKERPDGSVVTSNGEEVTTVKRGDGSTVTIEKQNDDGTVLEYSDKSGHWTSDDGVHWSNEVGQKKVQAVHLDGEGTLVTEDGKTTSYEYSNGTKMVQDAAGGKRFYDAEGHLSQTYDADHNGFKFTYEKDSQYPKVTDPEGTTWSTTDGKHWQSADGKKNFNGSIEVDDKTGSVKYNNDDTKTETTYRTDGSKSVRDKNPDSATFGQITTEKDGVTKVDQKPIDKEYLERSADAFFNAADGAGTYVGDMQAQIKDKTEEERAYMDEYYKKTHGYSMEDEINDEIEDPAERAKTLGMLHDKDDTTADNDAAFMQKYVAYAQTPEATKSDTGNETLDGAIDQISSSVDERAKAAQKEFSAPADVDIRTKLASMSSQQIAEMNAAFAETDPQGRSAIDAIMADANISEATKEAIAIYAKGKDNMTAGDYYRIARLGMESGDVDMFKEAMANMSPEDRAEFLSQKYPDGKTGADKIKDAFDSIVDSDVYRDAMDYAKHGRQSEARSFQMDKGTINDSEAGVETKIKNMRQEDRDLYRDGKKAADKAESERTPEEKAAYEYYKETSDALAGIANRGTPEFKHYEDMIISGSDGSLMQTAISDDGYIVNSGADKIVADIEKMDEKTWDRLKNDPTYADELKGIYKKYMSGPDYEKVAALIDQKKSAESYEKSKEVKRTAEEALTDAGNDPVKVRNAVKSFSKEEQEAYKTNKDGFRDRVDQAIDDAAKPGTVERNAIDYETSKIDQGKSLTAPDVISKAYDHALTETDVDEGKVVSEILDAFKADPTLQERIKNPQTPEDQELARHFETAVSAAVDSGDYDYYVKPLVETGHLDAQKVHDLFDNYFDDDEMGFYEALKTLPPEEQKKMAENPGEYMEFLSPEDLEVAQNVLKQGGEFRPEDKMRAYMLGAGTAEQEMKDMIAKMTPEQIEQMKHDYAKKYHADLTADAISELSGKDLRAVTKGMARPQTASESLNDAIDERAEAESSIGSSISSASDSTGTQLDDAVVQYAKAVGDYAAKGETMPPEVQKEYEKKIQDAADAHIESQSAIADAVVDVVITVAALAGAIPSGGASLSAIAATTLAGGIFKVATKAALLGANYDITADGAADFASGAANAATAMIGGEGIIGGGTKIAEQAAKTAVEAAAPSIKEGALELAEQEIKAAVKEAVEAGGKEVSEKTIKEIAKKVAKDGMEAEAEAAIKKGIEKGIKDQAKEIIAKQTAFTAAKGAEGGAISGAISSAKNVDNDKTLIENMKIVFEGGGVGALSGAAAAIGFKAAFGGFKSVAKAFKGADAPGGGGAAPPPDAPDVPAPKTPADGPKPKTPVADDTPTLPRTKVETPKKAVADDTPTLPRTKADATKASSADTPKDVTTSTPEANAGEDIGELDTLPATEAVDVPAGTPDAAGSPADIPAGPKPADGVDTDDFHFGIKPSKDPAKMDTLPAVPKPPGAKLMEPVPAMDAQLPDGNTIETAAIGLDELPPGVDANTLPEILAAPKTEANGLALKSQPTFPNAKNPFDEATIPEFTVPDANLNPDTMPDIKAPEPGKFKASGDPGAGKLQSPEAPNDATIPEIKTPQTEDPTLENQPAPSDVTKPGIPIPKKPSPTPDADDAVTGVFKSVKKPDTPPADNWADTNPEITLPKEKALGDASGDQTKTEIPISKRPKDSTSDPGQAADKTPPDGSEAVSKKNFDKQFGRSKNYYKPGDGEAVTKTDLPALKQAEIDAQPEIELNTGDFEVVRPRVGPEGGPKALPEEGFDIPPPELPEPEFPPPNTEGPKSGPAKDMEVYLDEDFADDMGDVALDIPKPKTSTPDRPKTLTPKSEPKADTAKPDVTANKTDPAKTDPAKSGSTAKADPAKSDAAKTDETPKTDSPSSGNKPATGDSSDIALADTPPVVQAVEKPVVVAKAMEETPKGIQPSNDPAKMDTKPAIPAEAPVKTVKPQASTNLPDDMDTIMTEAVIEPNAADALPPGMDANTIPELKPVDPTIPELKAVTAPDAAGDPTLRDLPKASPKSDGDTQLNIPAPEQGKFQPSKNPGAGKLKTPEAAKDATVPELQTASADTSAEVTKTAIPVPKKPAADAEEATTGVFKAVKKTDAPDTNPDVPVPKKPVTEAEEAPTGVFKAVKKTDAPDTEPNITVPNEKVPADSSAGQTKPEIPVPKRPKDASSDPGQSGGDKTPADGNEALPKKEFDKQFGRKDYRKKSGDSEEAVTKTDLPSLKQAETEAQPEIELNSGDFEEVRPKIGPEGGPKALPEEGFDIPPPELPTPEIPPPNTDGPKSGPAKDMEVYLDEDFADDMGDVNVNIPKQKSSSDTQVIELPQAKKPNKPDLPPELQKKIEAAESAPLPKPDIDAKPKLLYQGDLAGGKYGSRVEVEINGSKLMLERPPSEGYYYKKAPSTDDVKTSPSENKVHVEAADAAELAKMQAVLIPALENDPALKDLVANWKTIDPRYTTPEGKWGYAGHDQGTVGPPKGQAKPGDRGQDSKAFTIYVGDKEAAEAVAKRIDDILGQYPEFQGKDVIPTGNSDTLVGDTNRVGVVKDHLPKAPDSTPDQPQAKLDDEIGDAIKNDPELAANARKNGTSPLTELENELGLKPGTVHEDENGNIVIDLPPQKSADFNQYENDVYLDESEAGKEFGQKTARPAIYAIYKKYGYDPKDF